jgi:hypothetical protein
MPRVPDHIVAIELIVMGVVRFFGGGFNLR